PPPRRSFHLPERKWSQSWAASRGGDRRDEARLRAGLDRILFRRARDDRYVDATAHCLLAHTDPYGHGHDGSRTYGVQLLLRVDYRSRKTFDTERHLVRTRVLVHEPNAVHVLDEPAFDVPVQGIPVAKHVDFHQLPMSDSS